jgi:16S rRNA (uracil1498-N3)-methyltransferase
VLVIDTRTFANRRVHMRLIAEAEFDPLGLVSQVLGACQDVSSQVERELELAQHRSRMVELVDQLTREPEAIPDVGLAFAPVKRAQTDWLVEKATELGAARLLPVRTRRTVAERVRHERLEAIAIEAAEQCGRTRLPEIAEPMRLNQLLQRRDASRRLYFADEAGGEHAAKAFTSGPALILIGPEGGFTDDERTLIRAAANAVPISLGPRILRAETAALAALAAWMSAAGDWR